MTAAPKRECTDATVLARLKEMAGHRYQPGTLAVYFGVSSKAMTARLRFMEANGMVRRAYHNGYTAYYWPNAEDLAREAAAALQPGPARTFNEYRMPQPMLDLAARLQAERDAIPSMYYKEAA